MRGCPRLSMEAALRHYQVWGAKQTKIHNLLIWQSPPAAIADPMGLCDPASAGGVGVALLRPAAACRNPGFARVLHCVAVLRMRPAF